MTNDLSPASDGEVIARLRSRDTAALAELYDRYGRSVYSLALSIVRDRTVAEDITHEVFLHLWRYPESYDPERGAFAPWLLRSVRNRAIDALRRTQRDRSLAQRVHVLEASVAPSDPDEMAVLGEEFERVRRAVAELEHDQREIVELAYFGGFTQREIAERLGLPLGTVKTRLRAALRRLAEVLLRERERWTDSR